MYSEKTNVVPLPFINSPLSDYDTIYTALRFGVELCVKSKQKSPVVMFDQPLYIKVSINQMWQGHTFAREVQAHLLIQTTLSNIILEQLNIGAEERLSMRS
ncbi:hypothetical protein PR048_009910 [Dryococelus australis]|uniref:Uncharacterized protein n=1 Tax=Dryococelus australis TaxID=614101 RepID=A0ABQ9I182_9NEOP|nr:hypothetical protein PR048_009910 [Dryococelus australis]